MVMEFRLSRLYRVSENEGQTEKGYKTLKIGGLDHLFGISVISTSERFYGSKFFGELLFFQPRIAELRNNQK